MTTAMSRTLEPSSPSDEDIEAARVAVRALACFSGAGNVHVAVEGATGTRQGFMLPATAVRLLANVLAGLAEGCAVSVMRDDKELTTQQAADVLNVSRPYLIGLLEANALPHHKTGTHRRILLRDLLIYQQAKDGRNPGGFA